MMTLTREQVLNDVLSLMTQLAGDWEYSGELTSETRLLGDLAMESLALVVLGAELDARYGRLPFPEFFAELGQREVHERDVTVGELVEFICRHRVPVPSGDVVS
jgi:acyl carrier protein